MEVHKQIPWDNMKGKGNSWPWSFLVSICLQLVVPTHFYPPSRFEPYYLTVPYSGPHLWHLACASLGDKLLIHETLYLYANFLYTREPVSCIFLQYGYFTFDEFFPWGLTIFFCLHTSQRPTVAETHPQENIFTSPGVVAIINYLLFYHSSI